MSKIFILKTNLLSYYYWQKEERGRKEGEREGGKEGRKEGKN